MAGEGCWFDNGSDSHARASSRPATCWPVPEAEFQLLYAHQIASPTSTSASEATARHMGPTGNRRPIKVGLGLPLHTPQLRFDARHHRSQPMAERGCAAVPLGCTNGPRCPGFTVGPSVVLLWRSLLLEAGYVSAADFDAERLAEEGPVNLSILARLLLGKMESAHSHHPPPMSLVLQNRHPHLV